MNNTNLGQDENKIVALYCRLSVDDDNKDEESNSITNQKTILSDYAKRCGYKNTKFFVDDGISGTTFNRPAFIEMERMVENGEISTIIVKDLSRFGREQVEMGRLTQVVYPSLGVTFISIQENVNSKTGAGMEIMPFYTIFNEWYAAQTSKKIRQVWKTKSDHGERVASTVAYGYKRDKDNPKQWIIDDDAAKVVRYIYSLCLAGKGPTQIARILTDEKVLIPTAYYDTKGINHVTKTPADIYKWNTSTIIGILENRQYTGCAVNFLTTTVSYKVHKVVENPKSEQVIIPNMQEPIIPEEEWLRVQELRKNKRRHTKTGRTSIFSGLVFCYDCGAKLHFSTCSGMERSKEHFRCGTHKVNKDKCSLHYIRDVVLEQIVLEAISNLASFIRNYEPVFLYVLSQRHKEIQIQEQRKLKQEIVSGKARIVELDRIIERLYEDNALGKIPEERFYRMMKNYDAEQKELVKAVEEKEIALSKGMQDAVDLNNIIGVFREATDIKELDPTLVNTLIERIEVHQREKINGKKVVKVDIYFTAIGMIDIPTQNEIDKIMDLLNSNPNALKEIA